MVEDAGIRQVEIVGAGQSGSAGGRRHQARIQGAAGGALGLELGGFHQPRLVAHAVIADAVGMHHAVAVEPVVVAIAVDFVSGGTGAVQRAAQFFRPAARDGGIAHVVVAVDVVPSGQPGEFFQRLGELLRPVGVAGLGQGAGGPRAGQQGEQFRKFTSIHFGGLD